MAAGLIRRYAHPVAVAGLSAAFAVGYGAYSLTLHHHFRTYAYDLVIFDQVVRAYARFERPVSVVLQARKHGGRDVTQLADHFSPIHAVLAPTYWLHDGPVNLLIAQAILLAAAIPAIWLFTRRAVGPVAAYLVSTAFALSWPIQCAIGYDYHEVAFAVPLYAWMLERFQARRYGQAALTSLVLLLVKEDQGAVVFLFGLLLFLRARWRPGLALAGIGLGAFALVNVVLMPLAGAASDQNWHYGRLGDDAAEAAEFVLLHPLDTLVIFATPDAKTQTLLWLFAPLLFTPLRSSLVLLAVPLLAERMLSDNPNHWQNWYHYNAFVAPILFCAAVEGVARLPARPVFRLVAVAWAGLILALNVALTHDWPLHTLTERDWWRFDSHRERAAAATVERVPAGVLVATEGGLAPHLSPRCRVVDLYDPYGDTLGMTPWVVVDAVARPAETDQLIGAGYRVTYRADPYLVLHNPTVAAQIPSRTKHGTPLAR